METIEEMARTRCLLPTGQVRFHKFHPVDNVSREKQAISSAILENFQRVEIICEADQPLLFWNGLLQRVICLKFATRTQPLSFWCF